MTLTGPTTAPLDARRPSFWYGLPVGYMSLDLNPSAEQLTELINQLREVPEQARRETDRALRLYAGIINLLNSNNVQECALGLHPDEGGGLTVSVFTVSTVATPGNAKLVVAGLAGSAASNCDEGVRPLVLPCGLGYLSEKQVAAPRSTRRPDLNQTLPSRIWQSIVAVPAPGSSELIVLQMVTPDLHTADDYRNILLGIARTLTFTDPERTATDGTDAKDSEALTGAAATMRNDFG
ncbi:hypothetical protein [Streptomyces gilvifuscus]|uniref:Uncharacterized protein n=1 Tax=Streptomyces gilvifuscus TaxID=1550617 RepID=A0ABT5G223_9ACTN|nr:hypothetical protein [Streptomyces gilvifuscus]MDC2958767.1 hypothetical protein [Streptomyces gilvifuscus]